MLEESVSDIVSDMLERLMISLSQQNSIKRSLKTFFFRMLTNGLRCTGTDLLIQCLRPGVQCVVGGKSSDASRLFPPDFYRYPFRAGSTLTEFIGSHP